MSGNTQSAARHVEDMQHHYYLKGIKTPIYKKEYNDPVHCDIE